MARLNEFKYILSTHWTCLLCHHTPPERSNRYSRFAGRSPGHTQWLEASALSRKRFFAQRCRWETDDHLLVPRGVPATWDALKKRREEEKKKEDRKVIKVKKKKKKSENFKLWRQTELAASAVHDNKTERKNADVYFSCCTLLLPAFLHSPFPKKKKLIKKVP